jgi:hypothetical protein
MIIPVGEKKSSKQYYPLVNIQKTMENPHFQWANPLFLWPFSIAFSMVYQTILPGKWRDRLLNDW